MLSASLNKISIYNENTLIMNTNKLVFGTFIFGILFAITISNPNYNKRNVIWSDAEGYYMYLPAWFIHNGFESIDVRTTDAFKRQPATNKYYTKYTMGVALGQVPLFLITDIVERKIKNQELKGNEWVYSRAIQLSGWFFYIFGVVFLIKWLCKQTSVYNVYVAVIGVTVASNLWYYATKESGASHIYSFGLFALIIYVVDKVYRMQSVSWLTSALFGVSFAWVILIRPTNAILGLFLLFYTPTGKINLIDRLRFWTKNRIKLIPFIIMSVLLWYIQIRQWSAMLDETAVYSYKDEGFVYWMKPKILRVLVDVQNGLFLYSPIILISFYGLLRNFSVRINNCRLILLVFFIITWIFGSWWAWWFGGAYGHRCYVEFYTILILPLVWVVGKVNKSDWITRFIFYLLLILMAYYSLGLTHAYRSPWDGVNWNWARFSEIVRSLFPPFD